jgi:hypothetical protein
VPYIIRPRQISKIAAGFFSSLLLIVALPSLAQASCPSVTTTKAFSQFGDSAYYALVQNGKFESGAAGWSLSRSEVVSESGIPTGGSRALAIKPGGEAVSPAFCVSNDYPTFRFLYREVRGGGKLYVGVRWRDDSGVHETDVAALEGTSSWAPSPVLDLASNLPLDGAQDSLSTVQLTFATTHPGLEWAIDYVYVDPYSR